MTSERKSRKQLHEHEVVFYTYPKLLFVWPLILSGFLFWFLGKWSDPETLAWIWGIVLILTTLTIGIDLNRNVAAFWFVVIGLCWLSIIYLRDVKGFTIFGTIYRFFADLNPAYSGSLGLIISIVLAIPYAIMIVWTRVNDKWRITHNEFEHIALGRADDSLGRGAKRVRSSYPDFLEFVLCLAGDLIVYDAMGRRVLRTIPHVPFLPMVRKKINRILEMTAVTVEHEGVIDDEEAAAEAAEMEDAANEGDTEATV